MQSFRYLVVIYKRREIWSDAANNQKRLYLIARQFKISPLRQPASARGKIDHKTEILTQFEQDFYPVELSTPVKTKKTRETRWFFG